MSKQKAPEYTQSRVSSEGLDERVHPAIVRLPVNQVVVSKPNSHTTWVGDTTWLKEGGYRDALELLEQGRRRELDRKPLKPGSSKLTPAEPVSDSEVRRGMQKRAVGGMVSGAH